MKNALREALSWRIVKRSLVVTVVACPANSPNLDISSGNAY